MSYQEDRFTEIADAIRFKEGSSASIKATDFAQRIRNLSTGSSNKVLTLIQGFTNGNGVCVRMRLIRGGTIIQEMSCDSIPSSKSPYIAKCTHITWNVQAGDIFEMHRSMYGAGQTFTIWEDGVYKTAVELTYDDTQSTTRIYTIPADSSNTMIFFGPCSLAQTMYVGQKYQ